MDKTIRIALPEQWSEIVLTEPVRPHRHETHHLDATGDHQIIGAGYHTLRGEIRRLLGRTAFAVQRYGGEGFPESPPPKTPPSPFLRPPPPPGDPPPAHPC